MSKIASGVVRMKYGSRFLGVLLGIWGGLSPAMAVEPTVGEADVAHELRYQRLFELGRAEREAYLLAGRLIGDSTFVISSGTDQRMVMTEYVVRLDDGELAYLVCRGGVLPLSEWPEAPEGAYSRFTGDTHPTVGSYVILPVVTWNSGDWVANPSIPEGRVHYSGASEVRFESDEEAGFIGLFSDGRRRSNLPSESFGVPEERPATVADARMFLEGLGLTLIGGECAGCE